MAFETPSPRALRQLFRMVDRDGNRSLSHAEFKAALMELGLSADSASISALLRSIDQDRSGFITETEFVNFFQGRSLAEVQNVFAALRSDDARITIVAYGVEMEANVYYLSSHDLEDWLESKLDSLLAAGARLWFDIQGMDETVATTLETAFTLPRDAVNDLWMYQRQKIDLILTGAVDDREVKAVAAFTHSKMTSDSLSPSRSRSSSAVVASAFGKLTHLPPPINDVPLHHAGAEQFATSRAPVSVLSLSHLQQPCPAATLLFHAVCLQNQPVRRKHYWTWWARTMEKWHLGTLARAAGLISEQSIDRQVAADTVDVRQSRKRRRAAFRTAALTAAAELADVVCAHLHDSGASHAAAPVAAALGDSKLPFLGGGQVMRRVARTRTVLSSGTHLRSQPPDIATEQLGILVASQSVVITAHQASASRLNGPSVRALGSVGMLPLRLLRRVKVRAPSGPPLPVGVVKSPPASMIPPSSGAGAAPAQRMAPAAHRSDVQPRDSGSPTAASHRYDASRETRDTVVSILLSALRERIAQAHSDRASPADVDLASSSAPVLATEAVSLLHKFNFASRDQLEDWHTLVESSVHSGTPSPLNMPHLYALEKTADAYARVVEPMRCLFDPRKWGGDLPERGASSRRRAVFSTRSMPPAAALPVYEDGSHLHLGEPASPGAAEDAPSSPVSLASTFGPAASRFATISREIESLYSDVQGIRDACGPLRDVHHAQQDERRNSGEAFTNRLARLHRYRVNTNRTVTANTHIILIAYHPCSSLRSDAGLRTGTTNELLDGLFWDELHRHARAGP